MRLGLKLAATLLALFACPAAGLAQAQAGPPAPFDPFRAEKNIEIGEYYLKKKNYDAAIDRFKEAIRYKSNFARPHRLLGETYEKKGDKAEAVNYYQKYLEILPGAEDAAKVRKRIAQLQREMKRETTGKKRPSG